MYAVLIVEAAVVIASLCKVISCWWSVWQCRKGRFLCVLWDQFLGTGLTRGVRRGSAGVNSVWGVDDGDVIVYYLCVEYWECHVPLPWRMC